MRSLVEERLAFFSCFGSDDPEHPPRRTGGEKWGARDYEQDYYRAQHYLLDVNPDI
jgi:hypothetical protein